MLPRHSEGAAAMPDHASDPALARMTEMVGTLVKIMDFQLIAVDLADVRTVMRDSGGRGAIGIGEASGPGRAVVAAQRAIRDLERNIALTAPSSD